MFPRLARVLPSQPVDVPHYAASAQVGGVPLLTRAEGSTRFDPATLGAEERAAQHGELLGLVAVPAELLAGARTACLVQIGQTPVQLWALQPLAGAAYVVTAVYDAGADTGRATEPT
jgi:hypothetical protein